LAGLALELRVFFSIVIVQFAALEKLIVFDEQFDGFGPLRGGLNRGAQKFGCPMTAVDRDELHGRAHSGLVRCRTRNHIFDAPVLGKEQPQREPKVSRF